MTQNENNHFIETNPKLTQILELAEKDIKAYNNCIPCI